MDGAKIAGTHPGRSALAGDRRGRLPAGAGRRVPGELLPVPAAPAGTTAPAGGSGPVLRNLIEGLIYVWRSPVIRGVVAVTLVMNLLGFPYQNMVPVIAKQVLGLGPLLTGLLLAATASAHSAPRWSSPRGGTSGGRGACSRSAPSPDGGGLLFSFSGWYLLSFVLLFLAGAGIACFATMQSSLVLTSASDAMRGRAMGVLMLAIGFGPLGRAPDRGAGLRLGRDRLAVTVSAGTGVLVLGLVLWKAAALAVWRPVLSRVSRVDATPMPLSDEQPECSRRTRRETMAGVQLSVLTAVAAAGPIVVVLVAMVWLRWSGTKAGLAGALVAGRGRGVLFGATPSVLAVASWKAVILSVDVLYIVWAALILYNIAEESGAIRSIGVGVANLTEDHVMQLLDPRVRVLVVPAGCGGLRRAGGGGRPAAGRPRVSAHAGRRGAAGGPCLVRDDGDAVTSFQALVTVTGYSGPGPGAVVGGIPGDCLPAHRIRRGAHPCGVPAHPPLFRGDPGARPVDGAGPVRAGLLRVLRAGKLRGGHGGSRGEPGRGAACAGGAGELLGTASQLAGARGTADAASRPGAPASRSARWDFTWPSPPITR